METKINIAEILKDKLENTKLYSPLFGDVYFYYVGNDLIKVKHHGGRIAVLFDNGRYYDYPESELLLFPSKEMRDWSKFAWKKGDVLISDCGFMCIFKEWASDDYTKFNGCYFDGMPNTETAKCSKLDDNTAYGYIRDIENKCGGKLNLETLEIEKSEFKDGDIIKMTWDSEHKMIVDLPKNCEFKPFDKVICRDSDADIWKASFFSHYDERAYYPFFCNNCGYKYCLPYNDETAKLIGTTNNVEG